MLLMPLYIGAVFCFGEPEYGVLEKAKKDPEDDLNEIDE
jgi:hypothetical protein